MVNLLLLGVPFLYPVKTSENLRETKLTNGKIPVQSKQLRNDPLGVRDSIVTFETYCHFIPIIVHTLVQTQKMHYLTHPIWKFDEFEQVVGQFNPFQCHLVSFYAP